MLPLIEAEITGPRNWIAKKDFLDLVAVAQAAPGIFAVNIAIFTGYKLRGVAGAAVAALGAVLPSFVVILLIAVFCRQLRQNELAQRILNGVRPAVVALIVAAAVSLGKSSVWEWKSGLVTVLASLAVWGAGVSPVYVILVAGLWGFWAFGGKKV